MRCKESTQKQPENIYFFFSEKISHFLQILTKLYNFSAPFSTAALIYELSCGKMYFWAYGNYIMLNYLLSLLKLVICSAQLSTKFQLLIKTTTPTNKEVFGLSLSDVVFIKLKNVKMPTIVGILTFLSRINVMLS